MKEALEKRRQDNGLENQRQTQMQIQVDGHGQRFRLVTEDDYVVAEQERVERITSDIVATQEMAETTTQLLSEQGEDIIMVEDTILNASENFKSGFNEVVEGERIRARGYKTTGTVIGGAIGGAIGVVGVSVGGIVGRGVGGIMGWFAQKEIDREMTAYEKRRTEEEKKWKENDFRNLSLEKEKKGNQSGRGKFHDDEIFSRTAELWRPAAIEANRLDESTDVNLYFLGKQDDSILNMERQVALQRDILETTKRVQRASSFVGRMKNIFTKSPAPFTPDQIPKKHGLLPTHNPDNPDAMDEVLTTLQGINNKVQVQEQMLRNQNDALDRTDQQVNIHVS